MVPPNDVWPGARTTSFEWPRVAEKREKKRKDKKATPDKATV